jgi:glycosyltransferase involved in cell wall biosynthesis
MVLFELMESTHPYDGENGIQVFMKVQKGEVKPLESKRPKELVDLYNSLRNMVLITHTHTYIYIYIHINPFYFFFFFIFIDRILQVDLNHWTCWTILLFTIQLLSISFPFPCAFRCEHVLWFFFFFFLIFEFIIQFEIIYSMFCEGLLEVVRKK